MSNAIPPALVSENADSDESNFNLYPIDCALGLIETTSSTAPGKVLGYRVESTAPLNVEEKLKSSPSKSTIDAHLNKIARHLLESENSEVVIYIHGYANDQEATKERHRVICNYANKICSSKQVVFLGYIWPSEKPFKENWNQAIKALPSLFKKNFCLGGLFIVLGLALILLAIHPQVIKLPIFLNNLFFGAPGILFLVLSVCFCSILLTLVLLRLITYFRDSYRAANYGVPDLVELIRQIDKAVTEELEIKGEKPKNDIRLSFIGHSMGCFVVTNTIRILSNVFENSAIAGKPDPRIGRVFYLERLVLVAPDIPVETIMPRRANFLRSSLHRCKEAYVFCNEADLALRLASPVANYFSFPYKEPKSGYRLGNITAQMSKESNESKYGIVNFTPNKTSVFSPFEKLEIRSFDVSWPLNAIRTKNEISKEKNRTLEGKLAQQKEEIITDWVTYFDCTDYKDYKGIPGNSGSFSTDRKLKGIVSFAEGKSRLTWWDYLALTYCTIFRKIDTHSGYFEGVFSQQLMYDLAFIGFEGILQNSSDPSQSSSELYPEQRQTLLDTFSDYCQRKQIKVVLAPTRYEDNVPLHDKKLG